MLFNSHFFILVFLPLVWLGFRGLAQTSRFELARAWLVAASLFFYGWWGPAYLAVIIGSIVFNYAVGRGLAAPSRSRMLLAFGVAANLAALGWFKYANFFVDNLNAGLGTQLQLAPIVLPLAISFFTFQQIAFLVDTWRGERSEASFLDYCVFVTFFPQLIAGPIVHHREMLPQFRSDAPYRFRSRDLEVGLSIFFIGLFKKVVIADGIALQATPIFAAVAQGAQPGFFEAWGAALAYSFQLYFDFSGYSDMAIGLGRLFGIQLPINFASPYKSESIAEFWRRWHMTLSRFLRDYLYIALGGNRRGRGRRYVNLMWTMVLGGLWHGAGWTFLVWGTLHGLFLLLNHAWRALCERVGTPPGSGTRASRAAARTLTFGAVVVAWVFFRAADLATALRMLGAMADASAANLPVAGLAGAALADLLRLALLLALVWWAPNTQEIMADFEPGLSEARTRARAPSALRWRPSRRWATAMAFVSVWGLLGINQYSEFLYFQF